MTATIPIHRSNSRVPVQISGCLKFFGVKPCREHRSGRGKTGNNRGKFLLNFWLGYTYWEQFGMISKAMSEFKRRIKLCTEFRAGREDAGARRLVAVRNRILKAAKKHGLEV